MLLHPTLRKTPSNSNYSHKAETNVTAFNVRYPVRLVAPGSNIPVKKVQAILERFL